MLPSTPTHTRVGSFESKVQVLDSSIARHQLFSSSRPSLSPIPASFKKSTKTIQNNKTQKNIHARSFVSLSSSYPESNTTSPLIRHQMAAAISTPKTLSPSFCSTVFSDLPPVTPSPPHAPDAPLRRQGPPHPRFAAFATQDWVRPSVPLSPLTRRLQFAEIYRRIAASTHSPRYSASYAPDSPHADLAAFSPLSFASSVCPRSPTLANKLPDGLCPQEIEDKVEDFLGYIDAKEAAVERYVLNTPFPFQCESAVVSPVASAITNSWSTPSTSIATVSSGSPFAYRLPVLQREHTLLGALAGKRVWRFSSADKEAYLNGLHRDDPHNLLQTPDNVARTESLHKWIADIPTPYTPSPVRPRLSPSFFSPLPSPLLSSPSLADQASTLLSASPKPPSPCESADSLSFLDWPSPPASPSIRRSPSASIRSEQASASIVESSHTPTLTDALAKLKALVDAGPPSPVTRSPSPSPVVDFADAHLVPSPAPSASPSASPSPSPSPSPVVAAANTRLVLSPPAARSLKRKLPEDASPPPRRTRPAVTRFEPPTAVFHFSPALPESLPSFPVVLPSMPGAFPEDIPTNLRLEPTSVTRSPTASSISWKAVAGIAVGAFALGLAVSRFVF